MIVFAFMFALFWVILSLQKEGPNKEQELYERIMREGTYEQRMLAHQYKQEQRLDQLRNLVLFDIFFL